MLGLDGGIMHLHVVLEYADIATMLGLDGGIMHLHVVLEYADAAAMVYLKVAR